MWIWMSSHFFPLPLFMFGLPTAKSNFSKTQLWCKHITRLTQFPELPGECVSWFSLDHQLFQYKHAYLRHLCLYLTINATTRSLFSCNFYPSVYVMHSSKVLNKLHGLHSWVEIRVLSTGKWNLPWLSAPPAFRVACQWLW